MTKLTLYWNIASQPARAVKSLLEIGNINHQSVTLNISKNQSRTPEYLAINPFGQIPCIRHGDFVLAESSAILTYLCQKFPDAIPYHYYPFKNLQQKSRVDSFLSWYQSYLRPRLFQIINIKIYGKVKRGEQFTVSQLKSAEAKMEEALFVLDSILKKGPYVVPGTKEPTVVDLLVFHELLNMLYYQRGWEKYQNIDAWFKKMYSVGGCKKVLHDWFPAVKDFALYLAQITPVSAKL